VAVLVLAKDAPVKPIPINRAPLSKAMIGDAVRVIGFGFTSGYTYTGSGVKRQITTTITDVYQGVLSFGKAGKTSCQGDSGGPVLMKVNGVESVAGVLSYGYPNCAGSGSAARVDLCTSFLDPFLKLHGGECVSDCTGKSCGDDGCGGSCGICPVGQTCSGGQCVCAPDCNGRVCGDDGCGGSCGTCGPGQTCLVDGQCHGTCVPDCAGKECGGDGCGGSCGSCGVGESCSSGQCVALPQNPCDTNGGWETEPNNSAGAANVPCQTGMIYGVLDYSGDTDWFTFEVPPQNAFKVNLASMGYSMKLHHLVGGGLKLLQSAQSQISGTASGSGGAYFVEVYSAAGSFDLYTGYSVTITSGP
jgi:hypothetical protein